MVGFATTRAAEVAIAGFLGSAVLALYTVSAKAVTALSELLIQGTTRVAFPAFARLQGDLVQFRAAYYAGLRLTTAVAMPTFAGLAVLSPDLAPLLFGPQWSGAGNTMAILSLFGILASIGSYTIAAINGLGHPQANLRLDLVNALAAICAVSLAAPWGLEAAAAAHVGRAYLLWPLRYRILCRLAGVTFADLWRAVHGSVIAAVLMCVALVSLRPALASVTGAWRVGILVVAGMAVYFCALAILSPATLRLGLRLLGAMRAAEAKPFDGLPPPSPSEPPGKT